MYSIKSKEDWWNVFFEYEGEMRDIMNRFCVSEKDAEKEEKNCDAMKLVAGGEYDGLNTRGIYLKMLDKFNKRVDETIKDKDETVLLSMLNQAWWRSPDRPEIHNIAGWGVMCDLCSENWVFCREPKEIVD